MVYLAWDLILMELKHAPFVEMYLINNCFMLTKHQKAGRRISSESLSNLSISRSKIISFSLELWQRSLRTVGETSMKSLNITFIDTAMLIFYIIFHYFYCVKGVLRLHLKKKKKKRRIFQMIKPFNRLEYQTQAYRAQNWYNICSFCALSETA